MMTLGDRRHLDQLRPSHKRCARSYSVAAAHCGNRKCLTRKTQFPAFQQTETALHQTAASPVAALLRTTKGLTSDDMARLARLAQNAKDK
jgi:hypothetical protein